MIPTITSYALAAGLAGATAVGFSDGARSADDPEPLPLICDTNFVAGLYGFNATGLVRLGENNRSGTFYAAVGVIELRADGSMTVRLRQVIDGEPADVREREGTYVVNEDCTGTAEISTLSWEFVAVENASKILWIGIAEGGWVVEGDSHRIFLR
jgi:hypothetical protein